MADGGVPSNHELTTRLARVEEKQDHVVEKTDEMADTIDRIGEQHDTLWLAFQAIKWLIVVGSGSSVLVLAIQMTLL